MEHNEGCLNRSKSFPCCEDQMCPCDSYYFEKLKAENARYRKALEDIVHCIYSNEATLAYCEKKAREALKGIGNE